MKKSRVFALGLACFLSATAAFGALAATTGGGRFLSNLGDNSSINTDNSMTYKSGLDPENDPVVYTTDYGLEIRYSNALTNAALSGYTYFSVGGYNWVIIGYDPSMHEYVQDVSGEAFRDNPIVGGDFLTQFETVDNSAAGSAIMRDNFAISTLAVPNFEIGEGCVLCFCETYITQTQFNTSIDLGNNYEGSNLQKYIDDTVYGGTSELSKALQKLPIAPQILKTLHYNNQTSTIENAHLFPLAGKDSTEVFFFGTYLTQGSGGNMDIDIEWWLRSGLISDAPDRVYYIDASGNRTYGTYGYDYTVIGSRAVRPAFVLQL